MTVEDEYREHPSYGLIRFSRVTYMAMGNHKDVRLFGSHLLHHANYIQMELFEAQLGHGLSSDRYYERKPIAKVVMSSSQFAELITTLNYGSGVPCTIQYIRDVGIIAPDDDQYIEFEKVRESFAEKTELLAEKIQEAILDVEERLKKRSVTKTDLREALDMLKKVEREYRANMPFVLKQFKKSTERVVSAAKAEVDSFLNHVFVSAGMETIKRQLQSDGERNMLPFDDVIDVEED